MSHARVEELSDTDSDPDIGDPSSYLPTPPTSSTASRTSNSPGPSILSPSNLPNPNAPRQTYPRPSKEALKSYQTLYPVYFDSSRTRAQGRRVSRHHAISNPLALTIAEALRSILPPSAPVIPDLESCHPKDWANPGRVRFLLRDPSSGKPLSRTVKNKPHLYQLVGEYLKEHPTTKEMLYKVKYPEEMMVVPEKYVTPAAPRGWKIGELVPLHSAALSGGGGHEKMMKEMMEGMKRGELPGGMGGMPGMPGGAGGRK